MAKSYGRIYQSKSNVSITPFDIYNLYPVGSIYMSVYSTNPSNYFGGTWEQISKGRFLLGVGSPTSNNVADFGNLNNAGYVFRSEDKGGQYAHQLTIQEMPSHEHAWGSWIDWYQKGGTTGPVGAGNSVSSTSSRGGNANHNNVPPYLVVYMWKRVA